MTLMMFDVTLKHKNVSIYEAHSIYSFRVFIQIKTKTEKCGSFYQNLQKENKETISVWNNSKLHLNHEFNKYVSFKFPDFQPAGLHRIDQRGNFDQCRAQSVRQSRPAGNTAAPTEAMSEFPFVKTCSKYFIYFKTTLSF